VLLADDDWDYRSGYLGQGEMRWQGGVKTEHCVVLCPVSENK